MAFNVAQNQIENPSYLIVRTWADGRTSIMASFNGTQEDAEHEYLEICSMWNYEIRTKMFRIDIYQY